MTSGSQQVLGLLPKEICFQADQFHTICFGCTCVLALRFVCCRLQCTRRWAVLDAQRRLLPWHILLRPLLGYDRGYWWTVRCLCYGTYKNCKEFALLLMKKVVVRRFHIPRLYRQNNVLVHFNFSVLEEVIMCELFLDRHECSMGEWARSATHQMANGRLAS